VKKKHALKLHNGDEVALKETGEVLAVLRAHPGEDGSVVVEAVGPKSGHVTVDHRDVR